MSDLTPVQAVAALPNVSIIDHPVVSHKISMLRDRHTDSSTFRELLGELGQILTYEAAHDLPSKMIEIDTPLTKAKVRTLSGRKPVLVSVLRAGDGLLPGALRILPSAKVGHIGLARDHQTLAAIEYLCKLPEDTSDRDVFVLDPMLATGGSAAHALKRLLEKKPRSLRLISVLAAPEGALRIGEQFPGVKIIIGALDERLNEHGYIVPGLGDAGDRLFGTR